jgi:hypothetical protein
MEPFSEDVPEVAHPARVKQSAADTRSVQIFFGDIFSLSTNIVRLQKQNKYQA